MNLKEQVGQLFMLGFQGTEVSKDLRTLFQHYHPGGVILFSRNLQEPSQAAHLVNALQKLAPAMPLFVAIDQEGGRVARLPKGFTVFPGQGALGRAGTVELAYSFAEVTAKELRAIELRPFVHCFQNGLAAVMSAHVKYPALDPEFPATLSPAIMTDLLRSQLHFKGLALTDDLEMHAVVDHYSIEEAAIRSLQAGADILRICKDQEQQ